MLFLPFSGWSTLIFNFSGRSTLFLDLSFLSVLILDISLWSVLGLDFSAWSVLGLGISLWSILFLWRSKRSELLRGGSILSELCPESYLKLGVFSTAEMNFFRCLMYDGKSSRSQWFPPSIQRGSYFCLQSSQSCLPWEQSTTSSDVPCKRQMILSSQTA